MWNFEATTVLACFEKLKSRFELSGRSSGVGGGGASAPLKFCFVENLGKVPGNLGKILENLHKIPENLGKLPENTGKNGAQCLQNHLKTFLWRSSQRSILVGDNSCTKTFRASLGKFGKKSFASPKYCLFLLLWGYLQSLHIFL